MHFVFVTQGSAAIGLGHVLRCLAVAQQAEALGHQATFIVDKRSGQYLRSRKDCAGAIYLTPDYTLETIYIALSALQLSKGDWLILDGYQYSCDFINTLSEQALSVAVFDDNHLPVEVNVAAIINAAPDESADCKYAKFNSHSKLLLGDGFRPLRQEFIMGEVPELRERCSLTVNFGGSDPANLTLPVLQALNALKFTDNVTVITGGSYPRMRELTAFTADCHLNLVHVHDAQNMASMWSASRLAISAAGGSQFELAVCGTPSILAVIADNQIAATNLANDEGWCNVIDCRNPTDSLANSQRIAALAVELWQAEESLEHMHSVLSGKYDGLGARRIIQELTR